MRNSAKRVEINSTAVVSLFKDALGNEQCLRLHLHSQSPHRPHNGNAFTATRATPQVQSCSRRVLPEHILTDSFCEGVRGILFSFHFADTELFRSVPLLDSKLLHVYVPDRSQAHSLGHGQRSRAVAVHHRP